MIQDAYAALKGMSSAEKKALAQKCGISRFHLYNVMGGKPPSVQLASRIERATGGRISRKDLRPDVDWNLLSGTDVLKD